MADFVSLMHWTILKQKMEWSKVIHVHLVYWSIHRVYNYLASTMTEMASTKTVICQFRWVWMVAVLFVLGLLGLPVLDVAVDVGLVDVT